MKSVPLLQHITHHRQAQGKLVVIFVFYQPDCGPVGDTIHRAATLIELLQATLVHDSLVDDSTSAGASSA